MSLQTSTNEARLPKFYLTMRLTGLIALLVFGSIVYFFRQYFPYIHNWNIIFFAFGFFFVYTLVFTVVSQLFFRNKEFGYYLNLPWVFFYLAVIYATGGVNSQFPLLLVFPLLSTAFDLNPKMTKLIGSVGIIAFGAFILLDPGNLSSPEIILKHLIITLSLGIIAFYMYKIVKETLRQKYETEEAQARYGELIEIDRAKSDFITLTSHQLRTPLTEIRWAFSSLEEKLDAGSELRTVARRGLGSVERLVEIVDEMFQVPTLEKPDAFIVKKELDLSELLREIVRDAKSSAQRKGVALSAVIPEGSALIPGDLEKLRVAISNVTDNAINYSPRGEVRVSLEVGAEKAVIRVEDTGIGIPPEEQNEVFGKFFRGHKAMLLEPNESGVGLYITKVVIEKHDGTIDFVSRVGQGTTFTIALPLAKSSQS